MPFAKFVSRRRFLGQAGVATSALTLGCNTTGRSSKILGQNQEIVRAVIHPAIGIARVGNSSELDGYFIGPEVVEPPFVEKGNTRDATGALKRQAARFRIFGYNADGQVVAELNANNADVKWQVHLANKKAQWYRFIVANDISEAAKLSAPRRNATVEGDDRKALMIDGGSIEISGTQTLGSSYHFDKGHFQGNPVYLGELRTDDQGRLLVLGGRGKSASPTGKIVWDRNDASHFNNADGWYDDIADGPVTATVQLNGQSIPVEAAWVAVAPPNYAPDVISWRTLYDLLIDCYVENGMLPIPTKTSFTQDILPIFSRLSNLQWVNKGFADQFGRGGPYDFHSESILARLAEPQGDIQFKNDLLSKFRPPNTKDLNRDLWPWLYGDSFGYDDKSPKINLDLSPLRALHLQRWAQGDFIADWNPSFKPYDDLEGAPLGQRPSMLDQAALHFCLADAFHPGCELTWPMRHASMYSAPFRIKMRDPSKSQKDYGDQLTKAVLENDVDGPLTEQGPGDLTKWMAIPWQLDTVSCRSGYDDQYSAYLPTFWPARVPNQVLTEHAYQTVMDLTLARSVRLQAYQNREHWPRLLNGSLIQQTHQLIANMERMGVVEARPGIANDPDFPPVMLVETLSNNFINIGSQPDTLESQPRGVKDKLQLAGWENQEQLDEFKKALNLP